MIETTLIRPTIYDLHSHTTASDGCLTPTELLLRAVEKQVSVLAITDHDTLAGLDEAHHAIQQHALPIQLVDGIEISTVWKQRDIHIVGLYVDRHHEAINDLLLQQQQYRQQRAEQIAEKLTKAGIPDALVGAQALAKGAQLTRAHFARYLLQLGYAASLKKIFQRYLAKGKIGYVPPQWCSMEQAILAIHQAGGVAVLAHPLRYDLSQKALKQLIADFCQAKGEGIEVAACQQTPVQRAMITQMAIAHNLLASVGSDFHQPCAWIELGRNLWLMEGLKPIWEHWQSAIPTR